MEILGKEKGVLLLTDCEIVCYVVLMMPIMKMGNSYVILKKR